MYDSIDDSNIYKAAGCIGKAKITGLFSILVMCCIIYEIYTAFMKFIGFLVSNERMRGDLTEEELNKLADIIRDKEKIAAAATVIIAVIFILLPLIRTITTISRCSAASNDFTSSGDTSRLTECADYLRRKYSKTIAAFFVFIFFLMTSSSMDESNIKMVILNINLGFVLLFLPALLYTVFASRVFRLCGDMARTVPVQSPHTDRCGEKEHHYDCISGEQKDCYGKHKYDSYSEYESYSDDYDYFENDDRFKIDQSRYDYARGYMSDTSGYTNTGDDESYR